MGDAYTIADPYFFTLARWMEIDGVDPNAFPGARPPRPDGRAPRRSARRRARSNVRPQPAVPSPLPLSQRGRGPRPHAIFTYSKSPGWLLTPTRGGAIPGSALVPVRDRASSAGRKAHVVVVGRPSPLSPSIGLRSGLAGGADPLARTNPAIEALVRLDELEGDAGLLDRLVPAVDPALTIDDEVVEQARIEGAQGRDLLDDELAVDDALDGIGRVLKDMIVPLEVRFIEVTPDARSLGGV